MFWLIRIQTDIFINHEPKKAYSPRDRKHTLRVEFRIYLLPKLIAYRPAMTDHVSLRIVQIEEAEQGCNNCQTTNANQSVTHPAIIALSKGASHSYAANSSIISSRHFLG
jgi:hypothetical protein